MSVGERDKKMSDMASAAAAAFCHKYETGDKQVESSPETYLQYSIPYLTVRTLQRQEKVLNSHEKALASLEADSKWIKAFAIITGVLSLALVLLTIALAIYAWRLDTLMHSLQSNVSAAPSPTATTTPSPQSSPTPTPE
jgi:hypothetical protein